MLGKMNKEREKPGERRITTPLTYILTQSTDMWYWKDVDHHECLSQELWW